MLKIDIIDKTERKIKFILEGVKPQFANAIRRISMGEITTMSVDSVDFTSNDSVLYDEILAHRLAMIPLVFNSKNYKIKESVEDTGSLYEVVLVVDKKGPCTVYSKDIKSSDPDVKPLYDNIPIVELTEGQKLKFDATAILGYGKNHSKWAAAVTSYRYYPIVKQDGKISNETDVIKSCPKRALRIENGKVTVTEDCDLSGLCMQVAKPEGSLRVEGDPTKFIFTIESVSGLTAEQIMNMSLDELKAKAKDFSKSLSKLK
ncbi:MAG: DNA-directed RNA polymerase subunit D [Candidatus Aenigmarchaeota archaeon]|nr:DNA-directed RNA polymerase subunit D [Candidatus Aenigmarchaeota archaeon]